MSAIQTRDVGNVLVVSLTDAKILDQSQIEKIGYELMTVVPKAASGRMVLNLEGVGFMSSAMIGKIIQLNKKCKDSQVDLRLCSISDNVMEIFKVMRLNKVLNLQKDEATAVASFDKKGWFG